MRVALVSFLLAGSSAFAQTSPPAPPSSGPSESARAIEAAKIARAAAEEYAFAGEGGPHAAPFRLETKPLLQWSNPVAGSLHGTVFVWTLKGRPEVVASIYKWYGPKFHHLGVEYHSLSAGPIAAGRAGQTVWSPTKPGVSFKPVPGAPVPAESAVQRLRQVRALAKEFSAGETTREGVSRELRLLTQPVYRYAGTGSDSHPDLIDGALFTFVEGTDPEVFLLLEARRRPDGRTIWEYALTRMNSLSVRASHRGREVWSQPEMPWPVVFSHAEPYTVFTFQPGEGVNPPGPPDPAPGQ